MKLEQIQACFYENDRLLFNGSVLFLKILWSSIEIVELLGYNSYFPVFTMAYDYDLNEGVIKSVEKLPLEFPSYWVLIGLSNYSCALVIFAYCWLLPGRTLEISISCIDLW